MSKADMGGINMLKANESYHGFDDEEMGNESNNDVETEIITQRVSIDEPKTFLQTCYDKLLVIFSLCSICLIIFAKMFAVIGVPICFKIFYWIGALILLADIIIYALCALKNQKVKLDIQLGSIIVAIIAAVFIY
ncbi:MAG: hypothetical protein IKP71_02430 [Candidatus Riflebacteria bacterium]|nr:hypothetical protein [Candidatus Riflebacteria bacterium]